MGRRERQKSDRLVDFFNLVLQKNEDGLAILMGAAPPLSVAELYEMRRELPPDCGVRVDGGEAVPLAQKMLESVEDIEELISDAGGWRGINEGFRDFRRDFPERWKFIEEHALFIRPGGIIRDGKGGMSAAIGRKYDIATEKTLRRRYKRMLRSVANHILAWSYTDGYNISYTPPRKVKEN